MDSRIRMRIFHHILGLIVVAQGGLLVANARRQAPTYDEIGHLSAGISHWRSGTFDLYRVNPPLVRMVATLPLLLMDQRVELGSWDTTSAVRKEFEVGRALVERFGRESMTLFRVARCAVIPFAIFGTFVVAGLARHFYGDQASVAAACLWAFSPSVLGHGCLITPDIPAAVLGGVAIQAMISWARRPHASTATLVGLCIGAAISAKFSWLIFLMIMPVVAIVMLFLKFPVSRPRSVLHFSLMIAAACLFINAVYGFAGSFSTLGSFQFRSQLLSGPGYSYLNLGNRFDGSIAGKIPIPLPRDMVLGIDRQKMEFEQPQAAYAGGLLKERGGWWWYYIYAWLVKAPVGMLALTALAVLCRRFRCKAESLIFLIGLALLVLVSCQTGINKHLRYAFPVLPLLIVLLTRSFQYVRAKRCATLLVIFFVAESLWCWPHSMAFFNVAAGGPNCGRSHLANSNISWGQEVLGLARWQKARSDRDEKLYVALCCSYEPALLGLEYSVPREGIDRTFGGTPPGHSDLSPPRGVYAVDANFLIGYNYHVYLGNGSQAVSDRAFWMQFQRLEPIDQVGYSIFIYEVPGTGESRPESRQEELK